MKISLIITTYNWKEALDAVLKSVIRQVRLPDEVIIADDGSRQDTGNLIKRWQITFPVPLIHSWQEDMGFRAAMSRNKAVAKSSGDYLIFIDGDMVLSPDFVLCYERSARNGWFTQGGRVLTDKNCRDKIIASEYTPNLFSPGIRNRKNTISSRFLSRIFSFESNTDKSTRTCNMGVWRTDFIEVNGFDNRFVGWGREDSEFVLRMLNSGKRRLYLKFAAVAFHLFHRENTRDSLPENDKLLKFTLDNKVKKASDGLRFL